MNHQEISSQKNTDQVIEVRDVSKSFKTVQAVKNVSLNIYKGQFIALLGPNGAGKTTLVEMIEGIQKPDSGDILVMGKHWKGNEDDLHQVIGISLQETRFIDKLNVQETLRLFASFYKLEQKRIAEIIEIVGLEDKIKSYVVNLSGGQRQRLALGIALLNRPKILLLDEPTTGLDPNARREIWAILMKLKAEAQTSLILTTHYMEEAERLCDYIIIIHNGVVLKEGTLKQLLNEDRNEKMIEFELEGSQQVLNTIGTNSPYPIQWAPGKERGQVVLNHMETELPEFMKFIRDKNLKLKNLECRRRTLDDLFTDMTGRHLHE
jgi:ABC-2 type transport system ATP-binding protein